jgi:photosystem II stability/assembly factor-like uncharacterized protein
LNRLSTLLLLAVTAHGAWIPQQSGTAASLRGVSAVNSHVAWASGTKGTVLRTVDGGGHWSRIPVPDSESLDFRDVEAASSKAAWLLASGPGEKGRVYTTGDAGLHWQLRLTNPDSTGFFDAIALFSKSAGVLLGDPVDGRFVIYTTADGLTWHRRTGPAALAGEGAFAASGTCLIAHTNGEAWFGTGAARVFHSADFGVTWTASQAPLAHEGKSAGVFSLAFRDGLHGVAAGGDYTKPGDKNGNFAVTSDGGGTWTEPASRPGGYRSAVVYRSRSDVVATGTSGSDVSHDGGITWLPLDTAGYNALSFHSNTGWAVGPEGRIARWR